MQIIFEVSDYVKAITPFRNGCDFKAIFDGEDIYLDYGCYCLVNLQTGANEQFVRMLRENKDKPIKIDVTPEIKAAMMEVSPCKLCGGSIFKKRMNQGKERI